MRKALFQNPAGRQTAVARSLPAPVLGWNTEDALVAMKPGYAVILDNWLCRGAAIEMRRGYVDHVSGTSSAVETLVVYSGGSGDTLLACAGANIYDVTSSGTLGSSMYASAASARWNYTNFANTAGRFVLLANGAQGPRKYDGSAISSNTVSGSSGSITLTEANLKFVMQHKNRLHWGEKSNLRVWYMPVAAISGAADLLDLGAVFSSGGNIAGMSTWSRDNGAGGADDLAVYLTTEGQIAVYAGDDPGDANAWALVGVYDIAKPVGDRPLIRDGGELCVMTEEGMLPLSAAIATTRQDQKPRMLTAKVATAWSDAVTSYGSLKGWEAIHYSGRGSLMIVNLPTEEGVSSVQFVRSPGGGWSRFTGLSATCWAAANGGVYFGSSDGIYQWDVGASDNGEPITPDVLCAFNDFGDRTRTKTFTMVRALLYAPAIVKPAIDVVVDYDKATLPTSIQNNVQPGDISPDDETVIRNEWTAAGATGYSGAPRMRFSLTGSSDVDQVAVTADLTELLLVGPGGTDNILTRPNLPLDVSVRAVGFDVMFLVGGVL